MSLIYSFEIRDYLNSAVEIVYSVNKTLTNLLSISAGPSNTGPWTTVVNLSPISTNVVISSSAVPVGTKFLQLSATDWNGTSETSIIIANLQQSSGFAPTPIAIDENGVPRSLKVDSGGNLVVTGLTGGGSGTGDASAALQNQQIIAQTTTNTKLDSVKTSVDSVRNALGEVQLNASTISSLKQVTVTNTPIDYPDSAASGKLNVLTAVVAKDDTLSALSAKVDALPKKTDLPISGGQLYVFHNNVPTDYPDVGSHGKLSDIKTSIDIVSNGITGTNSLVSDIGALVNHSDTTLTSIETIVDDSRSIVNSIKNTGLDIYNKLDFSTLAKDITLSSLSTKVDSLFKSSDLPLSGTSIACHLTNTPTDYPDASATALLGTISTKLNSLSSDSVTITGALPSGSNTLGSVNVLSAPLPSGAATDTAVNSIRTAVTSLQSSIDSVSAGSIKSLLQEIKALLTEVKQNQLDEEVDTVSSSNDILNLAATTSVTTQSVNVSNCDKVTVNIHCTMGSGCVVTLMASINGTDFYRMADYTNITISGDQMHSITFSDRIRYIRLDVSNPSRTLSVDKITYEIRGK